MLKHRELGPPQPITHRIVHHRKIEFGRVGYEFIHSKFRHFPAIANYCP